jgi:hypothetical protein
VDEAGRALHEGRFGDVEPLVERIAESGRENSDASGLASAILLILRREQGRSDELVQPLEFAILQFPGACVFRCSLAKAKFDAGLVADARQDVEAILADGLAAIPRDLFWLASMNFLADLVASLGDTGPAYDEAEAHFETALAVQATSPPFMAHTEIAYAHMLRRRGRRDDRRRATALTEKALATAQRLGMISILDTVPAPPAGARTRRRASRASRA